MILLLSCKHWNRILVSLKLFSPENCMLSRVKPSLQGQELSNGNFERGKLIEVRISICLEKKMK